MDREKFFNVARKEVFGGRLSNAQVAGCEAILDACDRNGVTDPDHVALILSNVRRETGGYMLPIKETVMPSHKDKNPSDALVKSRLEKAYKAGKLKGVRSPYWRDGAYGRGAIQISLWPNYEKLGKRLGIPLRDDPELALDPVHSADIAVVGMSEGLFTGRKLSDYKFPAAMENKPASHPRRIVNGNDGSDAEITRDYRGFLAAIEAATEGMPSAAHAYRFERGRVYPVLKQVQARLRELGYPEVGEVDGKTGTKTDAAILAFRNDNDLPLVAGVDDALIVALAKATPREIAPARKSATAEDLKEAPAVKDGLTLERIGKWIGLGGIGAGVGTGGLDLAETTERVTQFQALAEVFVSAAPYLVLGGLGFAVFHFGRRIVRQQVEGYREGRHV